MNDEPLTLLYVSPSRIGKATAQAMELAERARQFTSIEIKVSPVVELQELRERLALAEAVTEAASELIWDKSELKWPWVQKLQVNLRAYHEKVPSLAQDDGTTSGNMQTPASPDDSVPSACCSRASNGRGSEKLEDKRLNQVRFLIGVLGGGLIVSAFVGDMSWALLAAGVCLQLFGIVLKHHFERRK